MQPELKADQDFDPQEKLYRRYLPEHLTDDGTIRPQSFKPLPRTSVNRERYSSSPEHVLDPGCCEEKDYSGYGVYSFSVKDVSCTIQAEGNGRNHEFYLEHVPLSSCEPHSEVKCREFISKKEIKDASKTAKERFRIKLSQIKIAIECAPN